ncbi:GPALPP motifs-containing protein 1-like isoform X2 [Daphnia pulex]|uniref:GPALPP motifs-containing protein 1-like isoform X2 n=1 Tax=Daphnia pulex TaxID=6669 RepID=UPI001EDEE104|nr:GPALPP motifs-containing protein 1-like isoform X2 [Daphnia pulex]XP_046647534.1 GPALPP motifs-containing protein 1-like isoform X2 [Daphnia pulicaria]
MSRIGPTLPPHLQTAYENDDSDSDEGDLYGPALPAHLKSQKVSSKLVQSNISNDRGCSVNHEVDSSSDDEVIGPLPADCMDAEHSSSVDIEQRALKMKRKLLGVDDDEANKQPKREDWMIELPELKRKNFGLGPRVFNRSDKPEVVGRDQWTSTPTSKPSTSKEKDEDFEAEMRKQYLEQKRNKKLEKIVAMHDKSKKRSESLLKTHQKEMKSKKDNSSGPKERKPFDRDEDLKLNQLDNAKRKSLIKKSQELNSKFKIGNQKYL